MYACSGILFNHESPRRNVEFVTRKVTLAAAKIKLGLADKVLLGNLDARRDWGFMRPSEDTLRVGNPAKAEEVLHWTRTVTFSELIVSMVEADLKAIRDGAIDFEEA